MEPINKWCDENNMIFDRPCAARGLPDRADGYEWFDDDAQL